MLDIDSLLIVSFPLLLILVVCYFYFNSKLKIANQQVLEVNNRYLILQTELQQEKELLLESKERFTKVEIGKAIVEADLRNLRDRFDAEINNTEQQIERFENLANRVLISQSESLDSRQKQGMKEILDPLKEKIKIFEEKIDKSNIETIKQHESLKEQIKYLNEKSEQVSKEANDLAKALKGDFKKQGNWGELILESILDKSGLVKDREYYLQSSEQDADGRTLRPDVVIHLPDEKKIIIDSKVSLVAYEAFVNGDTESLQKINQKAHVLAIRKHIEGLSSKNYHDLYKIASPDFVLMFIPIDTAFSAALQYDSDLYNYAFDKNIVIVTSSTLLATLKTVESMWRNDKQNRYAVQIAEEAGKMYDKFVGFVDDMDKLGKQLNTSNNTYNDAMKKLNTGTGNLLNRAEHLKELGAKANKSLPKSLD